MDPSTGYQALAEFSRSFGVNAPEAGVVAACNDFRRRVYRARLPDSLEGYLAAFAVPVESAPIASESRLDIRDDRYVILVRSDKAQRPLEIASATSRERFSIAHELGHLLLIERLRSDPERVRALNHPDVWERVEALCDLAASVLLIPTDTLIEHVRVHGISAPSICQLAVATKVSREVVLRRFISAGACACVVWRVRKVSLRRELLVSAARVFSNGHRIPLRRWDPGSYLRPNVPLRASRARSKWSYALSATIAKGGTRHAVSVLAAAVSTSELSEPAAVDFLGLRDRPSEIRGDLLEAHQGLDLIVMSLMLEPEPHENGLWIADSTARELQDRPRLRT